MWNALFSAHQIQLMPVGLLWTPYLTSWIIDESVQCAVRTPSIPQTQSCTNIPAQLQRNWGSFVLFCFPAVFAVCLGYTMVWVMLNFPLFLLYIVLKASFGETWNICWCFGLFGFFCLIFGSLHWAFKHFIHLESRSKVLIVRCQWGVKNKDIWEKHNR